MTRRRPRARSEERTGRDRPWLIVAALGVLLAVASGTAFYGNAVYLAALTRGSDGFSVGVVSATTGMFLLVTGLAGIVVAQLIERWGTRPIIIGGAFGLGLSLVLLGRVREVWQLWPTYALMGFAFAALTVVPTGRLIDAWFIDRRATALSLAYVGLPAGGVIVTPIVSILVERRGLAEASVWIALGATVTCLAVAAVLVEPRGDSARPPGVRPARRHDGAASVAFLATDRWFVTVTTVASLGMLAQVGAMSHLFNAIDMSSGPHLAAAAISAATMASLAGRIVGSFTLERFGLVRSTVVLLLVQSLSLATMLTVDGTAVFLAIVAVFGITLGNLQVLQALVLAQSYAGPQFGRVLALGQLGATIGMALGPVLVGILLERGGGYDTSFVILGSASGVAGVLMLIAAAQRRRA